MKKTFKHLFAALTVVLVALSSCEPRTENPYLIKVKVNLTNPSSKTIHCDFSITGEVLESGKVRALTASDITQVYVFAQGVGSNYHDRKDFRTGGLTSGSADFELDNETTVVEVTVRAVPEYGNRVFDGVEKITIKK